jgi:hypothetical protein
MRIVSLGRRSTALVVALGMALTTQSVAVGTNSVTPAADVTAHNASLWPDSLVAEQQLSNFEQKATNAGALGFYRDDATGDLVVLMPATLRTGFDMADLGEVGVPVVVEWSHLDAAILAKVQADLTAVPTALKTTDASMGFYFDPKTEKFEVTTTFDRTELTAVLGASLNYVDYHQGRVDETGRLNDSSPFKGGARIYITDKVCTTGFTVKDASGDKGIVTAAHCGPLYENVLTPQLVNEGQTSWHSCGANPSNNDMMIFSNVQHSSQISYTNQIYTGYTAAGSTKVVAGASDPAVGATYDYSGSYSLEHDNQYVTSLSGGQYWANNNCGTYWVLNLTVWHTLSSGNCDIQMGDSGGPLYSATTSSTVWIRGIINAYSSTACYGTRYSRISSLSGYTVVTG